MNSSTNPLSNHQTDLADRAGAAWKRYARLDREAFAAFVEVGSLLREAKGVCEHGQFGAVVERSGVSRSTATRAMKISAALALEPEHEIVHVNNLAAFGVRGAIEVIEFADRLREFSFISETLDEIGSPIAAAMACASYSEEMGKLAIKIAKEHDPGDSGGFLLVLYAKLKFDIKHGRGPFTLAEAAEGASTN